MRVIVMEDEPEASESLARQLREAFDARVRVIRSHGEFLDAAGSLDADPPQLIVMDPIMPWTVRTRTDELPKDHLQRFEERCHAIGDLQRSHRDLLVIVHSPLPAERLRAGVRYLADGRAFCVARSASLAPDVVALARSLLAAA